MSRPVQERATRPAKRGALFRATVRQLGDTVRSLRLERGWTLEEAADRMGLDARHLQRIESSEVNVTLATLTHIASGYETLPWLLLAGGADRADAFPTSNEGSKRDVDPPREVGEEASDPASIDPLLRTVGLRLGEARRESEVTQEELASRLRVPLEKLQRIEIGRAKTVPLKLILKVAFSLGVDPRSLFDAGELPKRRTGRPSVRRGRSRG